ncbi:MAG: SDR family NAD(P)-dependent oxidoreductase [Halobacteriales archaeon]
MGLLSDEVAVVTGGSSGIGRAIALAFAEHGADVVVADVREDPKEGGRPTREAVEADTDASATFVDCDVSDVADLRAAVEAADAFGGVTVMVNNAGVWHRQPFLEVAEPDYRRLMDVNLKGTFFGAQAAIASMVERDVAGCVVNVSSIDGFLGNGNWPTYTASKGGITTLTKALAHGFGDRGIRVNALQPGAVDTLLGGEPEDPEAAAEEAAAIVEQVPLGRFADPEDVAGAAVFLASDLAAYVTGEALVVDGGWTCWR